MSGSLHGVKVLVTRPKDQSAHLCRMIESAGGVAIEFPTIELQPTRDLAGDDLLGRLAAATHVIFVSRNAVRYTAQLVGNLVLPLAGKSVFAVGEGTRHELVAQGLDTAISPGAQSGSEELLELPELAGPRLRGQQVLIVRGAGGRELLREQLQARGASVEYADVYERIEPAGAREKMAGIWGQYPDVVVVTSGQGLQNLIRMTAERDRAIMLESKLVVMSHRIAEVAAAAGFRHRATVADEQSDQGLLQAIRQTVE